MPTSPHVRYVASAAETNPDRWRESGTCKQEEEEGEETMYDRMRRRRRFR